MGLTTHCIREIFDSSLRSLFKVIIMITDKHIEELEYRFKNGEKPRLPSALYQYLCFVNRGESWRKDFYETSAGLKLRQALIKLGLTTEKGLTKLGHYYYDTINLYNV